MLNPESLTHFVGSAEVRWSASGTNPAGFQEVRRHLGGMIIVQRGTGNAQTIRREYLLTDAQGSTYAVLDDYGMPINASARMSFDPFGKRRAAADWTTATPWSTTLGNELKDTTRKGYTGHEQVDAVGIIHMGGRIYDPNLGRFLQADPFIQAPGNSQSLNRYTYVFNNPMAWTDPTGYWGAREQAGLRTVAAIVIACFTGYYAGVAMSAGGATAASNAAMISFAGGFAAGAVQSGNLRGAVIGGISSLAFFGVAKAFPVKGMNLGTGEGMAAYSKLALASGVTGGIMAEVQGGRFGNGFISAGASAFLSPIPEAATSNPAGQMVVTAVIGGTISRISGGKFANGAITGSFQFAMGRGLARFGDDGLVTGSTAAGDLDPASVPSQISIEASGFPTRDDAAIDAGAKYGPIGVANSQEVELGFVYDASSKSWGYLTPGWGPPGSTRIDTTALTAAYNAFLSPRGQFLGGWMHGHWDAQLNFSSTDFDSVWKKNYSVHMVNRAGQVRKLNYGHLREGLSNMSGSTFRKELSGLKQFYKEVGLPGDAL